MQLFRSIFFAVFLFSSVSYAAGSGGFGISVGIGAPFVSQAGITYQFSDKFGLALGSNKLDLSVGGAKTILTMPELTFNYHPFSGSFFVALGVGQETLSVTALDSGTSTEVQGDVKATSTIVKLGWMWGLENKGFWFGMDASYVMPSGANTTLNAGAVPTTAQAYIDTVNALEQFGETPYANVTFAKMGWVF